MFRLNKYPLLNLSMFNLALRGIHMENLKPPALQQPCAF